MFDTIYIYVPEANQIVRVSEGSGDGLSSEDLDGGYVDYVYYEQYALEEGVREVDGGMVMLTEPFQIKFSCTEDAVTDVLDMAYGQPTLEYIVLKEKHE